MANIKIDSYFIKNSRTNLPLPVVNNIHLHSAYNPEREASAWVDKHDHLLREKNEILILGLGFGYHIREIAKRMSEYHPKGYSLNVIEANANVAEDCFKHRGSFSKEITVYSGKNIDELYQNENLLYFLSNHPGILAHPASLSLYNDYFKSFLAFKAPQDTDSYETFIHNQSLKDILIAHKGHSSLDEVLSQVSTYKTDDPNTFLLNAFAELAKGQNLEAGATHE